MKFVRVELEAPASCQRSLADFYAAGLGLELATAGADRFSIAIGETRLAFAAVAGEPFYHFAVLLPGDRFDAALLWAEARTELLPDPETGSTVFVSDRWRSKACYFHDPAGNIVELIAHRGIDETRAHGAFQPTELVGLSELGLVGDPSSMASALAREMALELWDGTLEEPVRLAFVGERARTVILAPSGRGWVPTGRPAEPHPARVVLSGTGRGDVALDGSRYRLVASEE